MKLIFIRRNILSISFSKISEIISVVFLILLFLSVLYEVIARTIFNQPTIWANELVGYFLVSASFIGSSYVLRHNKHLVIDLLISKLNKKLKIIFELIANLISFFFCFFVFIYGLKLVQISFILGVVSVSELRIPLWIPKLVIPLSFLFLSLEFLLIIKKKIILLKIR
jgi:TRAP-type C4-dicarboxylate transport system permease small subunit